MLDVSRICHPFADRAEAGRALAAALGDYAGRPAQVVLALPRGGVPVGYRVAVALGAPLDVFLVRKLGVPGYEELAMGAIASGGVSVWNESVVELLDIAPETVQAVAQREAVELRRQEAAFRGGRPPVDVAGKTVILVDDGLATGSTMRAAIVALRKAAPARVVLAVPVASPASLEETGSLADDCVCVLAPEHFFCVGSWYVDFAPTSEEDVRHLLAEARRRAGPC